MLGSYEYLYKRRAAAARLCNSSRAPLTIPLDGATAAAVHTVYTLYTLYIVHCTYFVHCAIPIDGATAACCCHCILYCILCTHCMHIIHSVYSHLIFVTDSRTVSVEKNSVMWRNFKFFYLTYVEKSKIHPHVEKFQISSYDRCGN